jgi:DNA-binding NtrC family response regulator/uncharacterized protein HemY
MRQLQNDNIEYSQCCRNYLEGMIDRRDFKGAIRYFESIRAELDANIQTTGIIMSLAARAFTSAGNAKKALPIIQTAIDILGKKSRGRNVLASAFMILGDTYRELGNFADSTKAFQDAESIYRRNNNLDKAGDALNRMAGIYFREGDFNSALRYLLEAADYARDKDQKEKLAFLFGNIGRVYTVIAKFDQAEEYLRLNIDLSQKLGKEIDLARALLSLGYVYIQMADFDLAEKTMNDAQDIIQKHDLIKEDIILLTYRGELAVRKGQFEEASSLLNSAAERGANIAPRSLLAARPLRWLAELMVARKNYPKGLTYANQAYPSIKRLDDKTELGAIYKLKAVCLEKIDRCDDAREHYQMAINTLKNCNARLELADCLAMAGHSGIFDTLQRLIYLSRAAGIYQNCRIVTSADKIQKEIANLNTGSDAEESERAGNENESSPAVSFPTNNGRMKKIIKQLHLLRLADIPILFTGETGTGKDFLARYFHSIARPTGPYVTVNCAAIPENLIEAELFGHGKGAFTGAETNRHGLFKAANGGVILLDEIGDFPLDLQAKLLSVLEDKKLRPLGTNREIELDLIILAATNRDLNAMAAKGSFRRDLYYRLAGITFDLPPLRDRKEDIPYLLEFYMRQFGLLNNGDKPDAELVHLFVGYDWPGNIRQLENNIKQLSAIASLPGERSLVETARGFFGEEVNETAGSLYRQVERLEKRLLSDALISAGGNKSKAARILSIHESTFRAKMKRYCLGGEAAVAAQ